MGDGGLNKPYSESTAQDIDAEVKRIVDEQWNRTMNLLTEKKDILENLANVLLEQETIERADLIKVLGKFLNFSTDKMLAKYMYGVFLELSFVSGDRPFKEMTTYEEYVDETSAKDGENKPRGLDDMDKARDSSSEQEAPEAAPSK